MGLVACVDWNWAIGGAIGFVIGGLATAIAMMLWIMDRG